MMKKIGLLSKLKARYDQARERRFKKQLEELPFKERVMDIFQAARFVTTDFWCNTCKRDCTGTGYRQVCVIRDTMPTAWYTGFCPKGHRMTRRITDKSGDPYYHLSDIIKRQRFELRDMLLTIDDPRFKEVYPEQYKKLMANGKETTDKK